MSSKGVIDCVVFDLGGVLIRWDPKAFVDEIFASQPEQSRPYALVDFCNQKDGVWAALDRGDIRTSQEAIDQVNKSIQDYDFSIEDLQRFFDGMKDCLTPIPAGVRLLEAVRARGHRTFVLSNYQFQLYEMVRSANGFFDAFDGAIVSAHVNANKPSDDIYRHLLEDYKLQPSQCVFIDDTLINVEGSKRNGIEALHCTCHDKLERELKQLGIID